MKFKCPVCKAEFPSLTETDWDNWLAHLVEEKRTYTELYAKLAEAKQQIEVLTAERDKLKDAIVLMLDSAGRTE